MTLDHNPLIVTQKRCNKVKRWEGNAEACRGDCTTSDLCMRTTWASKQKTCFNPEQTSVHELCLTTISSQVTKWKSTAGGWISYLMILQSTWMLFLPSIEGCILYLFCCIWEVNCLIHTLTHMPVVGCEAEYKNTVFYCGHSLNHTLHLLWGLSVRKSLHALIRVACMQCCTGPSFTSVFC